MAGLTEARLGPLTAADVPAAARLSASVGWNQDEADWARLVALHPEGCVAAWVEDELVGTATLARYGDALAWLGMVIVREETRGRGLGGRLVDAALSTWSTPPGAAVGLDATAFGAPLYARRGFETVAAVDRWAGVLRPEASGAADPGTRLPAGASVPGAREAGPSDAPALARLDAAATGVDRTRLIERLTSEPGTAVVVLERDGEPAAYAALRSGRERLHVGPVVAADDALALAVLRAAAERAAGREVFLDAVRSAARTALLERAGLRVARSLERMSRPRREGAAIAGPRVLAAAGLEWG